MEVDNGVTSMSEMANYHLWITSASQLAIGLHQHDARKNIAGYLATLPYLCTFPTYALGGG